MSEKSKGVASLLAAFPVLGLFGADKYYVGATSLGILQTVLTLTIVGILISGPWTLLSIVMLLLSIFLGGIPYLYPEVNWAPVSSTDKVLGGVVIFLLLVGVFGSKKMKEKFSFYKKDKKDKKDKNNKK
jgi:TM2 domain-containing membrane protein YozV